METTMNVQAVLQKSYFIVMLPSVAADIFHLDTKSLCNFENKARVRPSDFLTLSFICHMSSYYAQHIIKHWHMAPH